MRVRKWLGLQRIVDNKKFRVRDCGFVSGRQVFQDIFNAYWQSWTCREKRRENNNKKKSERLEEKQRQMSCEESVKLAVKHLAASGRRKGEGVEETQRQ
jgi:hypothetical protein